MSRRYDYTSPTFGGCCVPPPSWETSRDNSYRSSNRQTLVKQASITAGSSLVRTDSAGRSAALARVDSLSRTPLARADSNPRVLTRTDSNPRSPLARQDSGSTAYVPPPAYRSGYVDRFRNFDLM